ncbi:hypothetical protein ACFVVM_30345 [Nocardia sp. NPDC058176]|uniref:hypothetical protein n=1 Tax=Nocardia sp. NPDC058176 TaxID=3346368 RepID=UPI0036D791E1
MTPEILDRIVASIRTVVDDHLQDRDVFAWRFTLPVDTADPIHHDLETQWRGTHSGLDPKTEATYEIALSLVGDPVEFTDTDVTELEDCLVLAVYGAVGPPPCPGIPFRLRADQRTDLALELDREQR